MYLSSMFKNSQCENRVKHKTNSQVKMNPIWSIGDPRTERHSTEGDLISVHAMYPDEDTLLAIVSRYIQHNIHTSTSHQRAVSMLTLLNSEHGSNSVKTEESEDVSRLLIQHDIRTL